MPKTRGRQQVATPSTTVSSSAGPRLDLNAATPRAIHFDLPSTSPTLLAQASSAETAERLESCGYAVLTLTSSEVALVRRAGAVADRTLLNDHHTDSQQQAVSETSSGKRVLSVRRSPMHSAAELLHSAAEGALRGVSLRLQQEESFCGRLLLAQSSAHDLSEIDDDNDDDEEDASIFSAMLSGTAPDGTDPADPAEHCPEHEDRGLLTLVTGQTGAHTRLEVYDRVRRLWVRPSPEGQPEADGSTFVVMLAGATLHRATAGLVPRATDGEIGATRHRVVAPSGGDASSEPAPAAAAGTAAGAKATPRRSLVLRVRAQPTRRFACAALASRPGAVERFTTSNETVAEFIASKNYVSVNAVPTQGESVGAAPADAAPAGAAGESTAPAGEHATVGQSPTTLASGSDSTFGTFTFAPPTTTGGAFVFSAAPAPPPPPPVGGAFVFSAAPHTSVAPAPAAVPPVFRFQSRESPPVAAAPASAAVAGTTPAVRGGAARRQRPARPGASLIGDGPGLLSPRLVERAFQSVSDRMVESGHVTADELDALTGEVPEDDADCAMQTLGQLQALLLIEKLEAEREAAAATSVPSAARRRAHAHLARLTSDEAQLLVALRASSSLRTWFAQLVSVLAERSGELRLTLRNWAPNTRDITVTCQADRPLAELLVHLPNALRRAVRLIYLGEAVSLHQTAAELGIPDGDPIDVVSSDFELQAEYLARWAHITARGIRLPPFVPIIHQLSHPGHPFRHQADVPTNAAELHHFLDAVSEDGPVVATHRLTRMGRRGRDFLIHARIIEHAWHAHRTRRILRLASAVRGSLERAKAAGPPLVTPFSQGPALLEAFGPDVGRAIQHHLAVEVIQTRASERLERLERRRNGPLNLKVVTQDGNEIFFKCKMTTPLERLMTAFCNRQGVAVNSVRFLFDGGRVSPMQTPAELEMEDGDVIDVMVEQQGD